MGFQNLPLLLTFSLCYLIQSTLKDDRIGSAHVFQRTLAALLYTPSIPNSISCDKRVRSHGKHKTQSELSVQQRLHTEGDITQALCSDLALYVLGGHVHGIL